MKERKSIKKPRFMIAYAGSFIVVASILACIGLIVFGFASYFYDYKAETDIRRSEEDLFDLFYHSLMKRTVTAKDIADVKWSLVEHYSLTRQRYKVYFDNKEIADSSQTLIMPYVNGGEEYHLEVADKKYLEYFKTAELSKYWQTRSERLESINAGELTAIVPRFHEDKSLELVVREAYINLDECKFIPVVCDVFDNESNNSGTYAGPVVSIPVESESKIPDGYTLYRSNAYSDSFIAIIEGFDGTDNDNNYDSIKYMDNEYYKFWGYKQTKQKYIPFTTVYRVQIRTALGLILAAALVIAITPATIVYNVQKRKFDVFEFRCKMTDAMAHDLKSPMAAISACAENLSDNIDTENREYYAGKIQEKVAQMNKMVNDILEFSKSEKSTAVINKDKADVGEIIAKCIADNEHLISERSLKINCERKTMTIETDLNLFSQAISNLINNAALYSKEGTAIDVAFDENSLVISNIPKEKVEDAEELKQPFVTGSAERATHGSGLGLAIAENNLTILGFKLIISNEEGRFAATVKL